MDDFSATVVFRWLAAGDAGDFDAFDRLLQPDAIIHAPAGLSTANVEEEKAVWRDALAAMPDLRHDVQEVLVDDDVEMARVVAGHIGQHHPPRSTAITNRQACKR